MIIERPRLLRVLEESQAQTIVLAAPAGYGKTTLARQWLKGRSRCVEITASTTNSSAPLLFDEIATLLSAPTVPGDVQVRRSKSVSTSDLAVPTLGRLLLRLLDKNRVGIVFVDDFHHFRGTSSETLIDVIRRLGHHRTLIASRSRPRWATARSEMYGAVFVVSDETLRFSEEEVVSLAELSGTPQTLHLASKLQGWPLALGLATVTASDPPSGVEGTSLARFFTEEILDGLSQSQQRDLELIAILPSFDAEVGEHLLGRRHSRLVTAAIRSGLGSSRNGTLELHPLLRDHLIERARANKRYGLAVGVATRALLKVGRIEDAIDLAGRNSRQDLAREILEVTGPTIVRSGSRQSLVSLASLCRGNASCPPALLDLIEAELALRKGSYGDAAALAQLSLEAFHESSHTYARIVAGRTAFASWDMTSAVSHFKEAQARAISPEDQSDAAWGLALACIFGEVDGLRSAVDDLYVRRNSSNLDLVRWSIARLAELRLGEGVAEIGWMDRGLAAAAELSDPAAKTSFTTSYSYYRGVRGEYERGLEIALDTLRFARTTGLSFVVPHAEWNIAFCSTGLRRFAEADKYLRRVESHAGKAGDRYLIANAAILRARRHLMLGEYENAHRIAVTAQLAAPSNALRAELIAAEAAANALQNIRPLAREYDTSLWPIEARSLIALAQGIAQFHELGDPRALIHAVRLCASLGAWDSFVCIARAAPSIVSVASADEQLATVIAPVLQRSRDANLSQPTAGRSLRSRSEGTELTPREREVLELLRSGLKNRDIARALFISETTAKVHIRHILAKLGVQTRTQAAVLDD